MSSRRFLIPGAVVLVALVLGGIVAFAATRGDGDTAPYRLDVALPEVTAANRTPVGGATCPTGGRVADGQAAPLAKVEYAPSGTRTTAVLVAPGQLVPFKFLVSATPDAPAVGTIDFQAAWDRGGQRDAGLDGDAQVVCAFVDPTDASSRDEDQPATVVHAEAAPTGNNIVANFSAEGVDPGDRVVIEAWVVSRSVIPSSSGTLKLTLAATDPDTPVALAREELPFRLDYFDRVDTPTLKVELDDGDKATRPADSITYTITVTNPSQNALVPVARLDSFLGAGTALAGPVVVEDTAGTKTTCAASAAAGTDQRAGFTCELGFVNPLEKVVLTATATLLPGVERRYGEEPQCQDRLVDVCHSVVVTWKQSETGDGRASAEKPTDLPADTALTITKLLNAPAPFAYPGERVTFTYAVTNATTNVNYNQLRISDTACDPVEPKGGDTNNNGRLEPGESFRYECTIDKMDQSLAVSQARVDALLDSGQPQGASTVTQITLISPKLAVKTNADPNDVQVMRVTVTNVSPTGDALGSPNAPAPAFTDVTVSAIGCSNLNPVSKGVDGKLESGSSFVFTCRVDNAAQPPRVRAYALDPLGSSVTAVPEVPKQ